MNRHHILSFTAAIALAFGGCAPPGLPFIDRGVEFNCIPPAPEVEASVCTWAHVPKAVVFGRVEAITPRNTPVYGQFSPDDGPSTTVVTDDVTRCASDKLDAGMLIALDVTHVIAGDASPGPMSINIAGAGMTRWAPRPVSAGEQFEWTEGPASEELFVGQTLGLTVFEGDDGEFTIGRSELFVERNGGLVFQRRGNDCRSWRPPGHALRNSDITSLMATVRACPPPSADEIQALMGQRYLSAGFAASDRGGAGRGSRCQQWVNVQDDVDTP